MISIRINGSRAIWFLVTVMYIALLWMRSNWLNPGYFFEGDDAALCTGIARMNISQGGDHFRVPFWIPVSAETERMVRVLEEYQLRNSPIYRFSSMTGVYLLGSWLWRADRDVRLVMTRANFIAGSLTPLIFAGFLITFFGPFPRWMYPVTCLLTALSPEMLVSGSVYPNDKNFAVLLFTASLAACYFIRNRQFLISLVSVIVMGILFSFSVFTRMDTVLFLPAILWVVFSRSRQNGRIRTASLNMTLFVIAASSSYIVFSRIVNTPFFDSYVSDAILKEAIFYFKGKIPLLLSAFGIAQILIFTIAVAAYLIIGRKTGFKAGHYPIRAAVMIALLVLPEIFFLYSFPFGSQKYLLTGTLTIAGSAGLIFYKTWKMTADAVCSETSRRRFIAAFRISLILLTIGTFDPLGPVKVGHDGPRQLAGTLRMNPKPDPAVLEAKNIVSFLEQFKDMSTDVVYIPWNPVEAEALYYECAIRRWRCDALRTDITASIETSPYKKGVVQFWERLGFPDVGYDVFLSLFRLSPPDFPEFGLVMPKIWDHDLTEDISKICMFSNYIKPSSYVLQVMPDPETAGKPESGHVKVLIPILNERNEYQGPRDLSHQAIDVSRYGDANRVFLSNIREPSIDSESEHEHSESGRLKRMNVPKEIDFSRDLPADLTVSGLSIQEEWGRWSDSYRVIILFDEILPEHFTVTLEAEAFEQTCPIHMIAGDTCEPVQLENLFFTRQSVVFDCAEQTNYLMIVILDPTSPFSIKMNEDKRRLGIGLKKIWIE